MKKSIVFKIIYIAAVIVIALGLIYIALKETVPDLIPLIEKGDVNEIQAYLRSGSTAKGILCTILLNMLQVWSVFIPGMPIQVAAGCVYGFWIAFVICHLSAVAAQFIAIVVWRRVGRRLEKWLPVNLGNNKRFNELLASTAPPAYIVILACMIPIMPNGLIALLASDMEISVKKYTLSVWAGSIVNVILCCAVGNRIIQGDFLVSCIFILILVALFLFMWFFRNRILDVYSRHKEELEKKIGK